MLERVVILFPEALLPEMMLQDQKTQLFGADMTFKTVPETRMSCCLRLMGL